MQFARQGKIGARRRLVPGCSGAKDRLGRNSCGATRGAVFNLYYRFTGNPTEAEDLGQEVFLRISRPPQLPACLRRVPHVADQRRAQLAGVDNYRHTRAR